MACNSVSPRNEDSRKFGGILDKLIKKLHKTQNVIRAEFVIVTA